jgi:hypothetical protein
MPKIPPEQNGGGKPPHVPTLKTRGLVDNFACCGFTQAQIADYLNIDEITLRKYYREELDHSQMKKTGKLARNLYLDALNGDKESREFYLRTRGGFANAKPKEDDTNKGIQSILEAFATGKLKVTDK